MKTFSYAQAAKTKATESVDAQSVAFPASSAPIAQKPIAVSLQKPTVQSSLNISKSTSETTTNVPPAPATITSTKPSVKVNPQAQKQHSISFGSVNTNQVPVIVNASNVKATPSGKPIVAQQVPTIIPVPIMPSVKFGAPPANMQFPPYIPMPMPADGSQQAVGYMQPGQFYGYAHQNPFYPPYVYPDVSSMQGQAPAYMQNQGKQILPVEPKVRKAIKIVNPNTGDEVVLPKKAVTTTAPPTTKVNDIKVGNEDLKLPSTTTAEVVPVTDSVNLVIKPDTAIHVVQEASTTPASKLAVPATPGRSETLQKIPAKASTPIRFAHPDEPNKSIDINKFKPVSSIKKETPSTLVDVIKETSVETIKSSVLNTQEEGQRARPLVSDATIEAPASTEDTIKQTLSKPIEIVKSPPELVTQAEGQRGRSPASGIKRDALASSIDAIKQTLIKPVEKTKPSPAAANIVQEEGSRERSSSVKDRIAKLESSMSSTGNLSGTSPIITRSSTPLRPKSPAITKVEPSAIKVEVSKSPVKNVSVSPSKLKVEAKEISVEIPTKAVNVIRNESQTPELEEGEIIDSASNEMPKHIKQPEKVGNVTKYSRDYLLFFRKQFTEWPVDIAPPHPDVSLKSGSGGYDRGDRGDRGGRSPAEFSRRDSGSGKYRGDNDRKLSINIRGGKSGGPQRLDQRDPREMRGSRDNRDSRDSGRDIRSSRDKRASNSDEISSTIGVLKVGENAWQPKSKLQNQVGVDKELLKLEKVSRETIAILNKLTPEYFPVLSKQIIELEIHNMDILNTVINRIFDKALSEPHYGYMYAVLCSKMNEGLHIQHPWLHELRKSDETYKNSTVFRKRLLVKCQSEFESGAKWAQDDEECRAKLRRVDISLEERENLILEQEQRYKSKLRSLGNIRFVGELFKLKMLTESIMHKCIEKLCKQDEEPEEEQTESLCKLMTTVGQLLDHEKGKAHMDNYFSVITDLSNNKTLASRIRFMLMDLIELRKFKWISRTDNSGPKTIAQVRKDAAGGPVQQKPSPRDALRQSAAAGRVPLKLTPRTTTANVANEWTSVTKNSLGTGIAKESKQSELRENKTPVQIFKAEPTHVHNATNMFNILSDGTENTNLPENNEKIVMNQEQTSNKIKGTIDEWGSVYDFTEVIAVLNKFGTDGFKEQFIKELLEVSMEKKTNFRRKTAELFGELVETNMISQDLLIKVFSDYNEYLDDIVADVPLLYTYMGMMISHILQIGAFEFVSLLDVFGALVDSPTSHMKLLGETLKYYRDTFGKDSLVASWNALDIKVLLPASKTSEDIQAWKLKYGVEFL